MTTRIAQWWTMMLRLATWTAWFFAVGTLGTLVTFIAIGWPGDGTTTLASTTVGEKTYVAFGLTYGGVFGTVWLWSQAMILAAAIVLSTLSSNRLRRIGHVALSTWAALWLGNAIWLPLMDGMWLWPLWVFFGGFFLATIVRAARGWTSRSPRQVVEVDVAPGENDADAVQVAQ